MTGYIPTHITFISREPETIVNEWEDGGEINSFEARPTYVATNDKTKESGLSWAQGYNSTKRGITTTEAENKPFKSLRIVSYEKRNEGGGAFRAIADDKWYIDVRTDTLLDILVNHSIKGGEVQGAEFIWARVGSQAKVVRVGSSLHAKLIEATEINCVKPPKAQDLKPGDIYENKKGARQVFLGWCSTIEMEAESNRMEYLPVLRRLSNVQCWQTLHEREGYKVRLDDQFGWIVDFKKTCSYRKKAGTTKVPANWMEQIRTSARAYWQSREPYYDTVYNNAGMCSAFHVCAPTETPQLAPEFTKYQAYLP